MFTEKLKAILRTTFSIANEMGCADVMPEHLLLQLLEDETVVARLEDRNMDVIALRVALMECVDETIGTLNPNAESLPTRGFQRVIQRAMHMSAVKPVGGYRVQLTPWNVVETMFEIMDHPEDALSTFSKHILCCVDSL